jgi:hypothetical protein
MCNKIICVNWFFCCVKRDPSPCKEFVHFVCDAITMYSDSSSRQEPGCNSDPQATRSPL